MNNSNHHDRTSPRVFRFDHLAVHHQALMVHANTLEEARGVLRYCSTWPSSLYRPGNVWVGYEGIIGGAKELNPQWAVCGTEEERRLLALQLTILNSEIQTEYVEGYLYG